MVPRPFLEMGIAGFAEKDKPSQQSSEGSKLRESKSMANLMECKTTQQICTRRDLVLDSNNKDSSKARMEESPADQAFPSGWLSNKVPRLNSFMDVDQASETMSMIKKARVSVRARSESSMVSK